MSRTSTARVLAWALWDWATQPFSTVITTFVFSIYLTSSLFLEPGDAALPAGTPEYDAAYGSLSSGLGLAVAVAGVVIAIVAPLLGRHSDTTGRRKGMLAANTAVVAVVTALMFFVEPDPRFFVFGAVLIALGTVFNDLSYVPYNALLVEVSTKKNRARVGALGWGIGYLGGIVAMLIVYVGFIAGEPFWFGTSEIDSTNIRAIAVVCAVWIVVFSVPLFLVVPEPATSRVRVEPAGIVASYRHVFGTVRRIFAGDRSAFWFLISSAVYRDGLAAVFLFGGVIAAGTFGFGFTEVLMFGILGSVLAGVSTIAVGWIEQRIGSRAVIAFSLLAIVAFLLGMFLGRDAGPAAFWICGLGVAFFSGPAQSASRTLMLDFAPAGAEGEFSGLYATTGRAASFITPVLWSVSIALGGAQYWGGLAILSVVAVGFLLFLRVKRPPHTDAHVAPDDALSETRSDR